MTEDRKKIFAKPTTISDRQKAMNSAVRILTKRDHSKYELKQKLQQRGFASKVIDTVIAECERLDYINDLRTAHLYILQLKRKCFGRRYVRMALKKKRLGGSVIENLLLENYPEVDERNNAGKILQKKEKTFEPEEDLKKRKEKIYRFLCSRGFSKYVISELIRDVVK